VLIDVAHVTEFNYDRWITETVMELRLQPRSDESQRTVNFDLTVEPRGNLSSSVDAFGNVVHYFNFRPPHRQIRAVAHSIVETGTASTAERSDVWRYQFLRFDGPVLDVPAVLDVADRLRPDDETDSAAVTAMLENLTQYVHDRFAYRQGVTTWQSTLADLVALGAGVCQDFTHFWIAVCRAIGIPARYVSGYVHHEPSNDNGPVTAASHAWGEAWIPEKGWRGYDPTNPVAVTPMHVKVAVGRDYRDVPSTKGVFLGPAAEWVNFDVSTRLIGQPPSDPTSSVAPGQGG
jgi:transglutaminase-like putative cysteine protease